MWDSNSGLLLRTFVGHTDQVRSVAFSPDGSRVLTGGDDAVARLWNADTGAQLQLFSGHLASVYSVAFSPDGAKVLTGSQDHTAKVWNASTGAEIRTLSGHQNWVSCAFFSNDGTRILTASGDNTARIWDASTAALLRTFIGHTEWVYCVAYHPDGTQVATGAGWPGKIARLWDVSTGEEIRSFLGHDGAVTHATFSPDGALLLTGSEDRSAKLWDVSTGSEIRTFSGHPNVVTAVALSPDGTKVLTACTDGIVRLWNASTGAPIRSFVGHAGSVGSVAFSPDGGWVLTGGADATARTWYTNTGSMVRIFSGHTGGVYSVAFSPDGTRVLTGSADCTAKLWDAFTAREIRTFPGHALSIYSVAFSPDGSRALTTSWDSTAKLWDVATGAEIRTFLGHSSIVYCGAFSPDGKKVLTGSRDGTALVWELYPPRAIIVAGGGPYPGNAIARQTDDLAAYAYQVLRARGYEPQHIHYLSAFGPRDADGDGFNDFDTSASLGNLESTITADFGQSAGRLLVIMIDHGNRTRDFMAFRVNESQILPSTTMDSWLDTLQTARPVDVTMVVDSCYSGQFVQDCRETPAGRQRIVIASTGPNSEAVFLPPPDMTSFMHTFLGSAYMGNSMGEAWRAGKRFFEEFPVANQVPQISDGTTSTSKADREFFGATWAYGVQSTEDINRFFPAFEQWTTDTLVVPGTPVRLWARLLPGERPYEVVAVVRPPAPEVISGDPVTMLPHLFLQQNTSDPRLWETVTTGTFAATGQYVVSFVARYAYARISRPVFRRITVSQGVDPDATPIRAILVVGSTTDSLLASTFEQLGSYAYRVYLDRFQDSSGQRHPEWIEFLTPFPCAERDATPTLAAIFSRINALPLDVGRLYVHLIGESNTAGAVRLSAGDFLVPTALDSALDNLQSRQDCTVILVVDAPRSGVFLGSCRKTGTQQRVAITSGRSGDTALFLGAPTLTSLSQKFLASAYQGNHLLTGFRSARDFFSVFLQGRIVPQLDDDGDGVSTKNDGTTVAARLYLGRRYAFAGDEAAALPFILDITPTQTAMARQPVACSVRLIEGVTPSRVFGQLVPPAMGNSIVPIGSLPEIAFVRDVDDRWTWLALLPAPALPGLHTLTVYAVYVSSPEDKLTEPAFTGIHVLGDTSVHRWRLY